MVVLTDDDGQALRMRINDQNDCYCWPTQKFKNILLMRLFFLSKSKWIFQHFSIFMENYSMIFTAKSVKNLQIRISSKHSFENFYLNCFMIMPSLPADLTRTENVVYFEHFSPRFRLNKCVHTNYFVYILITKLSISSSDVVKNVAKISAVYIYFLWA